MVKTVVVEFSDREYQILLKLDEFEGDDSQKLKELFTSYLAQTPRLKAGYHLIKLDETQDHMLEVLDSIYKEYESSPSPLEGWTQSKYDKILEDLLQIEIIRPMGAGRFGPTSRFKKPWLTVYNSTSKVFPDLDEFSQAYIATVYMLDYFSRGTFEAELLRDATIILNEFYLYSYALAKKQAHNAQKAITKKIPSVSSSDDLVT
jgi:hypothetical protein